MGIFWIAYGSIIRSMMLIYGPIESCPNDHIYKWTALYQWKLETLAESWWKHNLIDHNALSFLTIDGTIINYAVYLWESMNWSYVRQM